MTSYLELCRIRIEQKFNRGPYAQWTNSDYELLSTHISEEGTEYISASSLKRIFGKVAYSSEPSISTLNILARYIGYKDWHQFIQQQPSKDANISTQLSELKKTPTRWKVLIGLFVLIGAASGTLFSLLDKPPAIVHYPVTFRISKETAPSNVVFEYNLKDVPTGSVAEINFQDHFARDDRENLKVLTRDQKTITHTYLVSGVYHPVLFLNKKPTDTLTVCVYSNEWEYLLAKYLSTSKEFYPVSSTSISTKNGILTIPTIELHRYILDTVSDFWIKYRYLKNFGFKPSSLSFEIKARSVTKFKNRCNELDIWIIGKKNNLVFKIFDPGCGGEFSKVQLGTRLLDGNYNDLSAFGHSLETWRTIGLNTKDGRAYITIDGKEIYQDKIEGDLGELCGFILHSKGGAEFDYVRLNADGKELVKEEF